MTWWMDDFRFALRSLRRRPGLSVAALLTLAVGIGTTTAVFSVAERLGLRPSPYHDPERLVQVLTKGPHFVTSPSQRQYVAWRDHARTVEDLEAYASDTFELVTPERKLEVRGSQVTPGFFELLGIEPALGHTFLSGAGVEAAPPSVVLSHELWRTLFDGNLDAIRRWLEVDGTPHEVIGVLPAQTLFLQDPEIRFWKVLGKDPESAEIHRAYARLRVGASIEAAEAELSSILDGLSPGHEAVLDELHDSGEPLFWVEVVWLASLCILLIACANVTSLLLARGEVRSRELLLRATLGAPPRRLVVQLLRESLLLTLLGGALGLLLAVWMSDALVLLLPESLRHLDVSSFAPRHFIFAALASLVTGVVCGLLPALLGSSPDLGQAASQQATTGSSRKWVWLRQGLVTGEVALSFALLLIVLLFADQIRRLQAVDPGFRAEGLRVLELELPETRYDDRQRRRDYWETVEASLSSRELPTGVAISMTNGLSPDIVPNLGATLEPGCRPAEEDDHQVLALFNVAPNYFEVLEQPILHGRGFIDGDRSSQDKPIVVSESLASRLWPGNTPVNRRLGLGSEACHQIIGVARDARRKLTPGNDAELAVYFPHWRSTPLRRSIVLRSRDDALAFLESLAAQLEELDPEVALEMRSAEDVLTEPLDVALRQSFPLMLFALLAGLLATVGIYSIVTYNVGRRNEEIGLRMALGADRKNVLRSILTSGLKPVVTGLTLGTLGVFALTRIIESQLYAIELWRPSLAVGALILALFMAAAAAWSPARRAARIDPVAVLRQE